MKVKHVKDTSRREFDPLLTIYGPHDEANQRGDFCFVMIQSSSAYRHGGQVAQVDSTLAQAEIPDK